MASSKPLMGLEWLAHHSPGCRSVTRLAQSDIGGQALVNIDLRPPFVDPPVLECAQTVLLIAELSGGWEHFACLWCGPGRQLILLQQPFYESREAWQQRSTSYIQQLARQRAGIEQVVLVGGRDNDPAAQLARAEIMDFARQELPHAVIVLLTLRTGRLP